MRRLVVAALLSGVWFTNASADGCLPMNVHVQYIPYQISFPRDTAREVLVDGKKLVVPELFLVQVQEQKVGVLRDGGLLVWDNRDNKGYRFHLARRLPKGLRREKGRAVVDPFAIPMGSTIRIDALKELNVPVAYVAREAEENIGSNIVIDVGEGTRAYHAMKMLEQRSNELLVCVEGPPKMRKSKGRKHYR